MSNNLKAAISRFADRRVLVLGDFMLDEYVHGTVERISPEAPVPVVVERSANHVPGGAGNVVRNLRALGAQVSVAGTVGSDEAGQRLREMMAKMGCDTTGLARLEGPSEQTAAPALLGNSLFFADQREGRGYLRQAGIAW